MSDVGLEQGFPPGCSGVSDDGVISNHASEAEPRVFCERGFEGRVADLCEPVLNGLGYLLVRVKRSGSNGGTVQVMAEPFPNGSSEPVMMRIEDCVAVSRILVPVLETEQVLGLNAHLEVSSPGIDRPLVRRSDLTRHLGEMIRVELLTPFENGQRRLRGALVSVGEACFDVRSVVSTITPDRGLTGGQATDGKAVAGDDIRTVLFSMVDGVRLSARSGAGNRC